MNIENRIDSFANTDSGVYISVLQVDECVIFPEPQRGTNRQDTEVYSEVQQHHSHVDNFRCVNNLRCLPQC